MGYETHIRLVNDKNDKKKGAPFLGRDFTWEIALGYLFEEKSILTQDEWKILLPQNSDEIVDEKPNPINPTDLLSILEKIKKYLYDNQDTLPFEIELDYDRMEESGLSNEIKINGSRCWLQGDSNVYEISTKIRIINYPLQPTEVDLWVDIDSKINIEGRTYYLKKVTRHERYKEQICNVIDYCVYAMSINENLYWTLWT